MKLKPDKVLRAAKAASEAWESDDLSPENTQRIMRLMWELKEALASRGRVDEAQTR